MQRDVLLLVENLVVNMFLMKILHASYAAKVSRMRKSIINMFVVFMAHQNQEFCLPLNMFPGLAPLQAYSPVVETPAKKAREQEAMPAAAANVAPQDVLVRQVLLLSRNLATVKASSIRVWMAASAHPAIQEIDKVAKAYAEQMKNCKSPDEKAKIGAMHMQMWNCLVELANPSSEIKAKYTQHIQQVGIDHVASEEICVMKICKAFHKSSKKLEFGIIPATPTMELYLNVVAPFLEKQVKAKKMTGTAPRGDLERQLQDWVNSNST